MVRLLVCNLRSIFFPDIEFSYSPYGASFKAKKYALINMPTTLRLVQICFSIIWATNKLSLGYFLVYMAKYPHAKKLKNPEQILRKTHHRQTDGLMNKTDFIGFLPQSWRFYHVFWKFRIKLGNTQYKKKEYN